MKIEEHREEYLKADAEGKHKILARTYGLMSHHIWKHKQSGKYIISHAGVQSIAAQEGITVDYDVVHMERGFVVVKAMPCQAETVLGQSTFGEASPDNTTQKFPVAMAEKRAYDRAVLIFALQSVGGHGADFYSAEEMDVMDDFQRNVPTESEMGANPGPLDKGHTRKADLATEDLAKLSRTELKERMKGRNRWNTNLFDKMFDLERDVWAQSWESSDRDGLASLAESVENRVAKEGV